MMTSLDEPEGSLLAAQEYGGHDPMYGFSW
jgi:hypothetical protein